MKNQDFKISLKIVWFLVTGNFLLTTFGALAMLLHWEYSQIYLTIGLMVFFTTWIIVLSDMSKNEIGNKTFWMLSMFYLPSISPIFYLIKRNKLLKHGQKLGE
jgi:hypothetical protein